MALLASALAADAAGAAVGSAGLGDPYFPKAGNGGYDVKHYALRLDYRPATNRLDAAARITANPTKDLSRFDLDYRGPPIGSIHVNGKPARFRREGQELIITPRHTIPDASPSFHVRVTYAGQPHHVTDPDGSSDGWIRTADGAFVAGEPQGSPTWFPCNDYPTDKATYRFRISVPSTHVAVANGDLVRRARHGGTRTFVWKERRPMASYLATVTTGVFQLKQGTAIGVPSIVAVDPAQAATWSQVAPKLRRILVFFQRRFGPYPFEAAGAIVDTAPQVGYALETQTRPIFPGSPGQIALAHELSHQWYGDSVTLTTWKEIWLNEGFATFAEWKWGQHTGGQTTKQRFDALYATPRRNRRFWNPPPGNPGSGANIFDPTIYERGAMTLEALRQKVGGTTFAGILRRWAKAHRYRNATTAQLINLAENRSGQNLDAFFDDWLYQKGKPAGY